MFDVCKRLAVWVSLSLALGSSTPASFAQVVNGDFSAGNTGFTSGYTFIPSGTSLAPGTYGIRTSPHDFNALEYDFGDHTTGSGNMLIADGDGITNTVWQESLTVQPGRNYTFSAWVSSVGVSDNTNPAVMNVLVNGTALGQPFTAAPPLPTGNWQRFTYSWNSGSSTSAVLQIIDSNTNTLGNDFALDDIAFTPVPEPSALLLAGLATTAWAASRHLRRR